jgi:hypothetical protein
MAQSKKAGSKKKTRRPHDGPHWGATSVPGYQRDGSDTTWYLVYGKTRRREEIGKGEISMRRAAREAGRRNEEARSRAR